MISGEYKTFYEALLPLIPKERMFHDALSTLAYGTDASFYRLIPKLVIRAKDEREIAAILHQADLQNIPVTFRAPYLTNANAGFENTKNNTRKRNEFQSHSSTPLS